MKHVIVVGGSKGLGSEVANQLSSAGAAVSVFSRNPTETTAARISHFAVDLAVCASRQSALAQAIPAHGPIDSIIFCQRYRGQGDSWAGELEIGLTATKDLIESAVPHFAADGARSVVIVGSVAGPWIAAEQDAGYHIAKAGQETLIRYYAVKLGPQGIRVNGVSPSAFIKEESRHYHETHPEVSARMAKLTPLRKMGTTADSAAAIQFFASDKSGFITGQNLFVDGGLTLQLQTSLG